MLRFVITLRKIVEKFKKLLCQKSPSQKTFWQLDCVQEKGV